LGANVAKVRTIQYNDIDFRAASMAVGAHTERAAEIVADQLLPAERRARSAQRRPPVAG
jgi:hypothetical protein